MQIVKTHLVNVCQHVDRLVEFSSGLVGIYGRNGVGKSNLLNVGAYANLTNDYGRTNGPRARCIRRGVADSEPSYHETWWEHNGQRFHIRRDLRRESHQLTVDSPTGGEPLRLNGAREIQAWLDATLRVKRQVIDNYLFVEQMQMINFIDQSPAERSETFAHLCGTTYMSKIYDALGERIKADLPLSAAPLADMDELRERIGRDKQTIRETKAKLREIEQEKLLSDERRDELQELVRRRAQYRQQRKQRDEWAETETSQAEDLAAAATEHARLEEAAHRATNLVAELAPEAEACRDKLRSAAAIAEKLAKKAKLQRSLAALVDPVSPVKPKFKRSAAEIKEELAALNDAYVTASRMVKTFDAGDGVSCPTCGTPTTELTEHLEIARNASTTLPSQIEKLTRQQQAWEEYGQAAKAYLQQQEIVQARRDALEADLAELADVVAEDSNEAELRQKIEAHRAAVGEQKKCEAAANTAARDLAACQARLQQTQRQLAASKTLLQELKVGKEEAEQATETLRIHEKAVTEAAVLRERLSNATLSRDAAVRSLDELTEAGARTDLVRSWLSSLTTLREEVFHRTKLPQLLHEDALEELVDAVNATLAEVFGDPFSVRLGEGLAFTAVKTDGDEDVRRLSGGQKAVLAIAFRLAINSIFAGGIGMMVLDEPTVGLDEENIDCLHAALTALADFAGRQGSQIIIITHDKRLETAFDRVIKL